MNSDNSGHEYSFSGFLDYTSQMITASSGIWKIVGYFIFAGTVISLIPQIYSLIKRRSSYGINPMTPFVSNFSQFILIFNIICLRSSDFIAAIQVNFLESLPRLMTFINAFTLWILYLPVIVLTMIYFDREHKVNRIQKDIQNGWKFNLLFIFLNVIGSFLILLIFFVLVIKTGIGSEKITQMGKVFGTITVFTVVIQYLPQFVTACKLKDNGSFSLLLLAIQAPGGTISAIFMAIGQSDHWSTWLSTLAASIQQFCLQFLCLFFKLQRRRRKKVYEVPLLSKFSASTSVVDPDQLSDRTYLN